VVCADLGRPAGHRCGGLACRPPPKSKKKTTKKGGASQPLPVNGKPAETGAFRSLPATQGDTPASPQAADAVDADVTASPMEVEGSNPPFLLAIEAPPEEEMDVV